MSARACYRYERGRLIPWPESRGAPMVWELRTDTEWTRRDFGGLFVYVRDGEKPSETALIEAIADRWQTAARRDVDVSGELRAVAHRIEALAFGHGDPPDNAREILQAAHARLVRLADAVDEAKKP